MIACCECGVVPSRPPNTQSTPRFNCQMVDDDSVTISAIRSVLPSSYSPTVGKGDFSVAEVTAATLEMGGRKAHTGSQRMSETDQGIFVARFRAVDTARMQVVAVEAKAKVKVGEKEDAKVKMLKRCLLAVCMYLRTITATCLVSALALSPLAQRYRFAKSEVGQSPILEIFLPRYDLVEFFGADSRWRGAQQGGLDLQYLLPHLLQLRRSLTPEQVLS